MLLAEGDKAVSDRERRADRQRHGRLFRCVALVNAFRRFATREAVPGADSIDLIGRRRIGRGVGGDFAQTVECKARHQAASFRAAIRSTSSLVNRAALSMAWA